MDLFKDIQDAMIAEEMSDGPFDLESSCEVTLSVWKEVRGNYESERGRKERLVYENKIRNRE